jgi:hypothetical protein
MNPTLKAGPHLTVEGGAAFDRHKFPACNEVGPETTVLWGDTNLSQPDQEHYDGTWDGEHPGPKIEEVTPAAAEDQ